MRFAWPRTTSSPGNLQPGRSPCGRSRQGTDENSTAPTRTEVQWKPGSFLHEQRDKNSITSSHPWDAANLDAKWSWRFHLDAQDPLCPGRPKRSVQRSKSQVRELWLDGIKMAAYWGRADIMRTSADRQSLTQSGIQRPAPRQWILFRISETEIASLKPVQSSKSIFGAWPLLLHKPL
jgi:hypothetical protein